MKDPEDWVSWLKTGQRDLSVEGKTCAQSLVFFQNAISRPVLFFKVSNKYIGKANKWKRQFTTALKLKLKKLLFTNVMTASSI